jgi:beta-galactosidase
VIARDTGTTPPPVPTPPALTAMPAFTLTQSASLWDNLPAPVHSGEPLTMEAMDQAYGYVLYRTKIAGPITGDLAIGAVHDYAQVYIDGKLVGTIDRRLNQNSVPLDLKAAHADLDILLENTGRVNFGPALPGERVGLLNGVTLAGHPLTGWDNVSLPMLAPGSLTFSTQPCSGPCFYRGTLTVDRPADTYLDTSGLGKGEVWVNGRPLGRFWNIGPQKALYLPASWLQAGANEVVVFDLSGAPGRQLRGLDHPVLDAPVKP